MTHGLSKSTLMLFVVIGLGQNGTIVGVRAFGIVAGPAAIPHDQVGLSPRVTVAPNTFLANTNPESGTTIRFRAHSSDGRILRTTAPGLRPAGDCQFVWDGRNQRAACLLGSTGRVVGSGAYFCPVKAKTGMKPYG